MSKATYKIYSQTDFALDKSWELIDQYLESEKVGHGKETAESTLREWKGVMFFIHQPKNVQEIYKESDFCYGKPDTLLDEQFIPFELKDLTRADCLTYISYLNAKIGIIGKKENLLQPVTKKGYYNEVFSFLEWVEDQFEENFENPFVSRKRAFKAFQRSGNKPRPKIAKYIPFDKLAHMLYIAEHDYRMDVYVFFLLLVHSPPRKSELLTTKRANVFLNPDLNYLESGFEAGAMKEGGVLFFLPPEVARVIKSYLKWLDVTYPNSEYLFPALREGEYGFRSKGWLDNLIKEIRKKIEFYFSAHWFRHTIITNRLHAKGKCKERCPPSISEKLMNHSPSGTEAHHYDQLSVYNRDSVMSEGLDPVADLKEDYKDYLKYHPYDKTNLTYVPKK